MLKRMSVLTLVGLTLLLSVPVASQEPKWLGVVIAHGQQRVQIESQPIVHRPYRPLHFYGNTVRRRHYRGTAIPLPADFAQGVYAFLRQ